MDLPSGNFLVVSSSRLEIFRILGRVGLLSVNFLVVSSSRLEIFRILGGVCGISGAFFLHISHVSSALSFFLDGGDFLSGSFDHFFFSIAIFSNLFDFSHFSSSVLFSVSLNFLFFSHVSWFSSRKLVSQSNISHLFLSNSSFFHFFCPYLFPFQFSCFFFPLYFF